MKTIFFTILLLLLVPQLGSGERTKKSVLYLNSYHHGYQWSDSINTTGSAQHSTTAPTRSTCRSNISMPNATIPPRSSRVCWKFFKRKYAGEHFDAVIVSDDDAFNFALRSRPQLFPGGTDRLLRHQ